MWNSDRSEQNKKQCHIDHIHDTWHGTHFHLCLSSLKNIHTFICATIQCITIQYSVQMESYFIFFLFISSIFFLAWFYSFGRFSFALSTMTLIHMYRVYHTTNYMYINAYINQYTYSCIYNYIDENKNGISKLIISHEKKNIFFLEILVIFCINFIFLNW